LPPPVREREGALKRSGLGFGVFSGEIWAELRQGLHCHWRERGRMETVGLDSDVVSDEL
jgi:hypothetical protein